MRLTRLSLKYALRKVKRADRHNKASKLPLSLLSEPAAPFWHRINQELVGRCPLPPSIGGITGESQIVCMWKTHFEKILNDPSCDSDLEVLRRLRNASASQTPPIRTDDVLRAIKKLKSGKSPGWDGLTSDHLLNLQPEAVECIAVLLDSMLNHATVPSDLIRSVLIPLMKDKSGMIDDASNYRGIALSNSMSKVLELIILERIMPFFAYK